MKTRLLLMLGALLFTLNGTHAQLTEAPLFKIKKFGIHLGQDQDRIMGMDHLSLIKSVNRPLAMELEDIDFDSQDAYSMICENPHIRLDLSVVPRFAPRSEMRFALVGMFNRIDAVYYQKYEPDGMHRTLDYESRSNEIALETSLLRKFKLGNAVTFYLGGGTNLGYSFGNEVSVSGYNVRLREADTPDDPVYYNDYDYFYESHTAANAIHQRLFAEAGIGVTIAKRIELNLEYRYGLGYKWAPTVSQISATNFRSGGVAIRYCLL